MENIFLIFPLSPSKKFSKMDTPGISLDINDNPIRMMAISYKDPLIKINGTQ